MDALKGTDPWSKRAKGTLKKYVGANVASTFQTPLGTVGAPAASGGRNDALMGMGGAYGAGGMAGGMSGGGAGMSAQGLYGDYMNQYNAAKQANESRYAQGMQGYGERYARGMQNLEGLGNQELADVRQRGEEAKAANTQRMTSMGLGGTTVGSTLNTGVDTQTNSDLGRAQERIRQQRLSTDANLSGDTLGFLERRNDTYPDMASYASLMTQMGQRGVGGAGGGAGGGNMPSGAYGTYNGNTQGNYGGGEGFGSVIQGDTGTKQNIYTRAGGADGGGMSVVQRTPLEQQLAKNPFYLDTMNPGAISKGLTSRWGAPALAGAGGVSMMPRTYRGE